MEYTPEIVAKLHTTLFEITEEVQRVCDVLGINAVALGGTAIGVHFWQDILPWDDDVDLGMLRGDYERFVAEAPALLGDDFFISEYRTDPETPFYWAKVRKRSTLFLESGVEWFDICHGIFVDIMPMDRVPNNRFARCWQRVVVGWLAGAFSCYPYWLRRGEIPKQKSLWYQKSWLSRVVISSIYRLAGGRRWLWHRLNKKLTCNNNNEGCKMVDVIRTSVDLASYDSVRNSVARPFGRLMLHSPRELEEYLHNHYPVLIKDIPEEQKVNHAPLKLSFDTKNGPIYE